MSNKQSVAGNGKVTGKRQSGARGKAGNGQEAMSIDRKTGNGHRAVGSGQQTKRQRAMGNGQELLTVQRTTNQMGNRQSVKYGQEAIGQRLKQKKNRSFQFMRV